MTILRKLIHAERRPAHAAGEHNPFPSAVPGPDPDVQALRQELAALRAAYMSLHKEQENLKRSVQQTKAPAKPKAVEKRGRPGERRRISRRRTRLDSCHLLSTDFQMIGPCLIYDQSDSGCRLKGIQLEELPQDFLILRATDAMLQHGQVRWKRAGECGVQIVRCIASCEPNYPRGLIRQAFEESRGVFNGPRSFV